VAQPSCGERASPLITCAGDPVPLVPTPPLVLAAKNTILGAGNTPAPENDLYDL
jgi:hypothetical protein